MAEDLVKPDSVSKQMLKDLFEAAYMSTRWDSDGDLIVDDGFSAFVLLNDDNSRIKFMALFKGNEQASAGAKLRFVNAVNDGLVVVRASVTKRGGFCFDHYLLLDGGVTKRCVVSSFKTFMKVLGAASGKDDEGVLA